MLVAFSLRLSFVAIVPLLCLFTVSPTRAVLRHSPEGWVPLTTEDIAARYRLTAHPAPGDSPEHTWYPKLDSGHENQVTENNIKVINPHKIFEQFKPIDSARHTIVGQLLCAESNCKLKEEKIEKQKQENNNIELHKLREPRTHTVKHVSEGKFKRRRHKTINLTTNKQGTNPNILISRNDNKTSYEVTELPQDLLSTQTKHDENVGYKYKIPSLEFVTQPSNNQKPNILQKILSKYNITPGDIRNLKNYELSRFPQRNTSYEYDRKIYLLPVPDDFAVRYKGFIPVPSELLALFLSNYGHYLPGYHNIGGGYKNLYGNLAINNIHNNKPFGPYKIFSDTDSHN